MYGPTDPPPPQRRLAVGRGILASPPGLWISVWENPQTKCQPIRETLSLIIGFALHPSASKPRLKPVQAEIVTGRIGSFKVGLRLFWQMRA